MRSLTPFNKFIMAISLCSLSLLCAVTVNAQKKFGVGQKVELYCDCFGSSTWVPATIEEDQGNDRYRVRFSTGTYDYKNGVSTQLIRELGVGEREERQAERRRLFRSEAEQYRHSVGSVASLFDPTLANANIYTVPNSAAEWATVMKDLTALDQLCTSKYPLLKNPEDNSGERNVFQMLATWCEIAAARAGYQAKSKQANANSTLDFNASSVRNYLQKSIDEPRNSVSDDLQQLLFEPDKWKAEMMKSSGSPGSSFPETVFAPIQEKADELKSLIEKGAPNRPWEQPAFNHPVEQGMARTKFVGYYPGVTVLKIGSSFGDWKMYKNSLGIPTNRFIRGWALLKLPNRPFCQAQEWIIKQEYSGGGRWSASKMDSFGGGGVFMRCN